MTLSRYCRHSCQLPAGRRQERQAAEGRVGHQEGARTCSRYLLSRLRLAVLEIAAVLEIEDGLERRHCATMDRATLSCHPRLHWLRLHALDRARLRSIAIAIDRLWLSLTATNGHQRPLIASDSDAQDGVLFVGSTGKERTDDDGNIVHEGEMWCKKLSACVTTADCRRVPPSAAGSC